MRVGRSEEKKGVKRVSREGSEGSHFRNGERCEVRELGGDGGVGEDITGVRSEVRE